MTSSALARVIATLKRCGEDMGKRRQPLLNADQLRPRESWFRLKMLWRMGGCVPHMGNLSSGPQRQYDEAIYPNCSAMVAEVRTRYEKAHACNHTDRGVCTGKALFECDHQMAVYLMTVNHSNYTKEQCPPPWDHMVDIEAEVERHRDRVARLLLDRAREKHPQLQVESHRVTLHVRACVPIWLRRQKPRESTAEERSHATNDEEGWSCLCSSAQRRRV